MPEGTRQFSAAGLLQGPHDVANFIMSHEGTTDHQAMMDIFVIQDADSQKESPLINFSRRSCVLALIGKLPEISNPGMVLLLKTANKHQNRETSMVKHLQTGSKGRQETEREPIKNARAYSVLNENNNNTYWEEILHEYGE